MIASREIPSSVARSNHRMAMAARRFYSKLRESAEEALAGLPLEGVTVAVGRFLDV